MQNAVNVRARIEPVRKRLVTDQIIERLIPAIATGSLPPGYRMVEDELASELGVSRVPVREAIRELSLQGNPLYCAGARLANFAVRRPPDPGSVQHPHSPRNHAARRGDSEIAVRSRKLRETRLGT